MPKSVSRMMGEVAGRLSGGVERFSLAATAIARLDRGSRPLSVPDGNNGEEEEDSRQAYGELKQGLFESPASPPGGRAAPEQSASAFLYLGKYYHNDADGDKNLNQIEHIVSRVTLKKAGNFLGHPSRL